MAIVVIGIIAILALLMISMALAPVMKHLMSKRTRGNDSRAVANPMVPPSAQRNLIRLRREANEEDHFELARKARGRVRSAAHDEETEQLTEDRV